MINKDLSLSIIIPTYKTLDSLDEILLELNNNQNNILEIIIVDSSNNNNISNFIQKKKFRKIKYYRIKKSFPGKARNFGINKSKGEWIAFIDSKTVPNQSWMKIINEKLFNNHDLILGSVKYIGITRFQKYLNAASFGNINHECLPGTLIRNKIIKNNYFLENVRAGEDVFWKEKIKQLNLKYISPKHNTVMYNQLPTNLIHTLYRYFLYSYHAAKIRVNSNTKEIYLTIILILSAIIIPKWNTYIPKWDQSSIFYIPHITKIYLISLIIITISMVFTQNLFLGNKKNKNNNIFYTTLNIIIFIGLFITVFTWNARIADWVETAVWYIPHITKIYVGSFLFLSILYRGIYLPLKRKVKYNYIFPYRWILIGLIGLCLDIVKAPGYILGAFRLLFNNLRFIKE